MILKADLNDVPALNALVNSAFRGEGSKKGWTTEADLLDGIRIDEQRLTELIQKPDSVILKYLDEEGKLTGCVHLEVQGDNMYLGLLTVSPTLQGKGIGKLLMKAGEEEARKSNCSAVYMTVITERQELIGWYTKNGYINTGKIKPFHSDHPQFGIPKKKLEFVVLEKEIINTETADH